MPISSVTIAHEIVREFLDALERDEARLLTWGLVDGGFTRDEIVERAEQFVSENDKARSIDPEELIAALLEQRLLVDLPTDGGRLYRTRMAEAVRLFVRLRQMFTFSQWRTGSTLVSDFRFALRPRVYPRRDIASARAFEQWDEAGVLNSGRRSALQSLLDRGGFRLAGFQVRATERVLRDVDGAWSRGMIVTVGTGSGKTLAFYLPALAQIATLALPGAAWTKALAIYPRNELLKDQFSETYIEARRLDATQLENGRRPITIGAYFGPTPARAEVGELRSKGWEETPQGYVCPFLRCPSCGGDLVWQAQHLRQQVERLDCVCGASISGDEVLLTRQRMRQSPPDLLFTTTETLNRVIGDGTSRHVFGLGVQNPPQIVLLDEVHTYVGTHGAHVALLLRRWRHAAGTRVQFTGLSATLRNAAEFFAQLTGLQLHGVEEIGPTQSELESEGMEYMLVLRGDPVSKTSLLSTTIQAAMLLRRVLAPPETAPADAPPLYGQKVFAFTDDLDVTNRLYHNLLDAEGLDYRGLPRPGKPPLASLRSRGLPDNSRRLRAGQSWYLSEEIGHPEGLAAPLTIGRTSSQDTGVNRNADVIVATASLEVGYNDPTVGAVLQHKAPRDAASFVQRKGRAGRLRSMRPWTVVILSDYGRDRLAYQAYETLFDPVLPPRVLPIANRYVLRIQTVFAFMDWLAHQLNGAANGSIYRDLSGPSNWAPSATRQREIGNVARRLLTGDHQLQASLERYLARALAVSKQELAALLWDPPRSLMMHVLPTLLRRVESGWRRVRVNDTESVSDYVVQNAPLPDFVPPNLFSDLNLPEVRVVSSVWPDGSSAREDSLPINQALRALVPGKVTRRFAVKRPTVSHWIPLPSLDASAVEQDLAVEDFCEEFEELGEFQVRLNGALHDVRCVRPWAIRPAIAPSQVNATSNSRPEWRSQLVPRGGGVELELPRGSSWRERIEGLRLHAHAHRSSVEVRRFSIGARATVRMRRAGAAELETTVRYVTRGAATSAAVGSMANVDGICVVAILPGDSVVSDSDANAAKVRAFRTAYFKHRVLTDSQLAEHTNVFQREWLHQVYLSALTAWAVAEGPNLAQANEAMQPFVSIAAEKVLRVIFESLETEETEEEAGSANERQLRLKEDVLQLIGQADVRNRLSALASTLWAAPDAEWHAWAEERYLVTLGGAVLEACRQLYPEASSDDLVLDIDPGPRPVGASPVKAGTAELWITETALGGGGVIEEIGRRYMEDPRRFFQLVENALGPSDREIVDAEITRILALGEVDNEIAAAFQRVRRASRHDELQSAVDRLEIGLESRGVLVNRVVMSAVHARITRPGSGRATDQLLLSLVRRWHEYEQQFGIEVDARVFSYLESDRDEVKALLQEVDQEAANERVFRFHAVYGLLWPRGNVIRSLSLATYNPFVNLPAPDRELVLDRLGQPDIDVPVANPEWPNLIGDTLKKCGMARLTATADEGVTLRAAVLRLSSMPLEIDFLHVFPRVEGVARSPTGFSVRLTIAEAIQ